MDDPFKFDPNSTENEGRWRLIDPEQFIGKAWFRKPDQKYPGISYVFGSIKGTASPVIQTIRFNKKLWTEQKASAWWEEHKRDYYREWSQKDWDKWEQDREKEPIKKSKIPIQKGIDLSKNIITRLGYRYVSQKEVTIDYRFEKGVGFSVGSIRRGKPEIGDIDILLTSPITKTEVKQKLGDKITGLVGGEKKIDFNYHYTTRNPYQKHQVRVNLFATLSRDTFGAALIHHSGPYEYNIYIRKKVKSFGEGWKLSQYGLTSGDGEIIPTPTERLLQEEIGVTIRKPSER